MVDETLRDYYRCERCGKGFWPNSKDLFYAHMENEKLNVLLAIAKKFGADIPETDSVTVKPNE